MAGQPIYENRRKAFIEALTELARKDNKIILIIADVGFSFIEKFKEEFPNQFLNCGVVEQTMMGVAAGFANAGWKPYTYTMKNFTLLRPMEQVRNDICYPKRNVKMIAVSGSASYRFLGMSHNLYGDQEMHLLASLPNLKSYAPKTEEETKEIVKRTYQEEGPTYIEV